MDYFVREGYEWVARLGQAALAGLGLFWLYSEYGLVTMLLILGVVGFATYMDIVQTMEDYGHLFEEDDDE